MIIVPRFATLDNTLLIIRRSAIPLIGCLGMTLVLMTGCIISGPARIVSPGGDINSLPESFLAAGRSEFWGINTTVLIALGICLVFYHSNLLVYLQAGASRFLLRSPDFEDQQHSRRTFLYPPPANPRPF